MPKAKKDGKHVNFYIDRQLWEAVEKYSEETGVTKTRILEIGAREYLEKRGAEVRKKMPEGQDGTVN